MLVISYIISYVSVVSSVPIHGVNNRKKPVLWPIDCAHFPPSVSFRSGITSCENLPSVDELQCDAPYRGHPTNIFTS